MLKLIARKFSSSKLLMGVKEIKNGADFATALKSSKPVVVDFTATWCGPCKMISPKFHEYSDNYTNVEFLKVDVDEVSDVAQECGIRAMPTFQIYKEGKMVEEIVGADPAKLENAIKKYN